MSKGIKQISPMSRSGNTSMRRSSSGFSAGRYTLIIMDCLRRCEHGWLVEEI